MNETTESNEKTDVVDEVIDGRISVYGDPVETFPRVAQVWSGIAGADISAEQVALMLMGYKLVRAAQTPDYSDNSDDVEGYLDIFRKIVGDDMVHARSVDEYLEKREARDALERAQLTEAYELHVQAQKQRRALTDHFFLEGEARFYCGGCDWMSSADLLGTARKQFELAHEMRAPWDR